MLFPRPRAATPDFDLVSLVRSPEWPAAVDPLLIGGESAVVEWADGVLDWVGESLADKAVFVYANRPVAARAALLAGSVSTQADEPKVCDHAILFDVLDHVSRPDVVLRVARKFCGPATLVHVRTHPWTARHATHAYRRCNKAFVHLVLTDDELSSLDAAGDFTRRSLRPLAESRNLFEAGGFDVIADRRHTCPVEDFFRQTTIVARLPLGEYGGRFPEWQMSQTFNDFVLRVRP